MSSDTGIQERLIDDESGLIEFPFGFYIEFNRSGGIRLPF